LILALLKGKSKSFLHYRFVKNILKLTSIAPHVMQTAQA